jgi:hypothetical protein
VADEKIRHGFCAAEIECAHFLKGEVVVVMVGIVVFMEEEAAAGLGGEWW